MTAEIEALKKERDSWFEASYALCGAMADQHDMHTLRILRLRQETWRNLCIQSVLHVHRSTSRQLDKLRETVSEFKHEVKNNQSFAALESAVCGYLQLDGIHNLF